MTREANKDYTNVPDSDSYLVWLDRCYKDLLQWKRKLKSYLFEPTTLKQFEIKEKLLLKLEDILKSHVSLLKFFRNNKHNLETLGRDQVRDQLNEAKKLEHDIHVYIEMCR